MTRLLLAAAVLLSIVLLAFGSSATGGATTDGPDKGHSLALAGDEQALAGDPGHPLGRGAACHPGGFPSLVVKAVAEPA